MERRTWDRIAVPIIEYVADNEKDARGANLEEQAFREIAEQAGCEPDAVRLEANRLIESEFISGTGVSGRAILNVRLLERGRRAADVWPAEGDLESLVATLRAAEATAGSEDDRTKLRRAADALAEIGTGVSSALLAAWLKDRIGVG